MQLDSHQALRFSIIRLCSKARLTGFRDHIRSSASRVYSSIYVICGKHAVQWTCVQSVRDTASPVLFFLLLGSYMCDAQSVHGTHRVVSLQCRAFKELAIHADADNCISCVVCSAFRTTLNLSKPVIQPTPRKL